ncbi:MAG: AAA family ATPase [Hyphomicrobiales bacterium]
MADTQQTFSTLKDIAIHLREEREKKVTLLFAYNGTGKTRLSMTFKELGKDGGEKDTLYFNAFTEDLFIWDNDLDGDEVRELQLNGDSSFFDAIEQLEMDTRIRRFLSRYADFDFRILDRVLEDGRKITYVSFERDVIKPPAGSETEAEEPIEVDTKVENIKVSRGEENIFIWCFFLAILQLVLDKEEGSPYEWVKYIYIDDPISSLDDNNAIAVAHHLSQMLKISNSGIRTILSSHHTLFFNVMCNGLKKADRLFLGSNEDSGEYYLEKMHGDKARFYHVAMLKMLKTSLDTDKVYTYHFGILRSLMEKTATFHGYADMGHFLKIDEDDEEGTLLNRIVQLLNHDGYSMMEPLEMMPENKRYFKMVLSAFMDEYSFNSQLFPEQIEQTPEEATQR